MTYGKPVSATLFLKSLALGLLLVSFPLGCGEDGPSSVTGPEPVAAPAAAKGPAALHEVPAAGGIRVFSRRSPFFAATGPLTVESFESLPWNGSSCGDGALPLDNPLLVGDLVVRDRDCLRSFLCPSPFCDTTNIVLHLGSRGRIDFPPGTGGVLLVLEGMTNERFSLVVIDGAGHRLAVHSCSVQEEQKVLGFTSPDGIARVRMLGTESGGPVVIGSVAYEGVGEIAAGENMTEYRLR